jgi:uncharacterized membrane protein YphA (DoxX/SURF4 family)
MSEALTAPLLVAAAVLCVAGVLKLRSPRAAMTAFAALGLSPRAALVRVLAVCELAIGAWCAVDPARPAAAAVACLYAAFALVAWILARRRSACGCFGAEESPASPWQSVLSLVFVLSAIGALAAGAHGVGWVLGRPVLVASATLIGIAGAAYATALAYTELPNAWTAWSAT